MRGLLWQEMSPGHWPLTEVIYELIPFISQEEAQPGWMSELVQVTQLWSDRILHDLKIRAMNSIPLYHAASELRDMALSNVSAREGVSQGQADTLGVALR